MKTCRYCGQVFKYRNAEESYREHFKDIHAKPKLNKNGTVRLNAVHQITLMLKGNRWWKTFLKERFRREQIHQKDESMRHSIKQLMEFEKKYNIQFIIRRGELMFK